MAILVARRSDPTKLSISVPGRRYDHLFFSTMALVMLVTVFVGFAHTYYLAGVFHAPLPSLIIHLHGAAFSCWILLLVAQTSLVSAGRVDIHRKLGIAGFLLACLMVILGVLAATDSLGRGTGPSGLDAQFFYVIPMTLMCSSRCIGFLRRGAMKTAVHKWFSDRWAPNTSSAYWRMLPMLSGCKCLKEWRGRRDSNSRPLP
jgi:hypothetical protein